MKVLLAIDGSSYSTAAVELVESRPWPPGTIVRVLMAVEPIMQPPDMLSGMVGFETLELARKELTSQAEQLVNNVAEKLRKTGFMVETEVSNGDPRSIIVDQAEGWSADLVVVGSHGYTGTKKIALGQCRAVGREPCSMFSRGSPQEAIGLKPRAFNAGTLTFTEIKHLNGQTETGLLSQTPPFTTRASR